MGEMRPRAHGRFVHRGSNRLYVRGVTYGTFGPRAGADSGYPHPAVVEADFALMDTCGINAVRTYTTPPLWLLDLAHEHGLSVMAGLPWEEHVAFLEDRSTARAVVERVRLSARACEAHPALLCYAVGNEIPASIVRWHGYRRVEGFLGQLVDAVREEDPAGLVAYVNYPSTEYLEVPGADVVAFNVYLESTHDLQAYLARLQTTAGERPLLVAELGLDSRRNGEAQQAEALEGQLRTAFRAGCAGTFVFAWTDEWHRGDAEILDWDFGLTRRDRRPKPALETVRRAFAETPFGEACDWPEVTVVVCTRNGARTMRSCCEGLLALDYPRVEVVVVDDGSTDASAAIASEYGFRVISTPNRGLSNARNTGLAAARGDIVAYLDDDARPDPQWLRYLVTAIDDGGHAGVGGPNLPPPGDGAIAECVACSPGGPTHVLLSDTIAEHIPGCNMAFRRNRLEAVGGFDPRFRIAGDDVDVCWLLQREGWTLGFSPSAVVWHHRRSSIRGYLRQQREYGRAEALLERKWPGKYNAAGHLTWAGRVYARARRPGRLRRRVRYGVWGSAAFQTASASEPRMLTSLPGMPEWFLLIAALALLASLAALWQPLLAAVPLLALAVAAMLARAAIGAAHAQLDRRRPLRERLRMRGLVFLLHLLQPLARLAGRLSDGLTPWRRRGPGGVAVPRPRRFGLWSERWHSPKARLQAIGAGLLADGLSVARGGDYDRWELEVRGGALGSARVRMGIEEHGSGRQLARFHVWPRVSPLALLLVATFGPVALVAGLQGAITASVALGAAGAAALAVGLKDCATAVAAMQRAIVSLPARLEDQPAPESAAPSIAARTRPPAASLGRAR
jgi:GT2 family glycosyltransferase